MTANTSCLFLDSSDFDPSWFQGGWHDLNSATFVGGSAKVTDGSGKLDISKLDGYGFAISGFVPPTDKAWSINNVKKPKVENPSNTSWWGTWVDTPDFLPFLNSPITGMPKGVVVDFITLFPPFAESIKGKKVIVDDVDLLLVYTGSWSEHGAKVHEDPGQYLVGDGQQGVLYSGGSTYSDTVGDMIQFPFTGTSVSVYGPLDLEPLGRGNVTVAFSIDNKTTTTTFPPPDAARIFPNFENIPSYNFFSSPLLDAGDHILTIQIMETSGSLDFTGFPAYPFTLDFIVYTAAFDSFDAMPQVHIPSSTSIYPSPTTSLSTTSPSTLAPTKSNVGAMAGGVVGGVISLVIVTIVALYLLRRRRLRRQAALDKLSAHPFIGIILESEKAIHNGHSHSDGFMTMFWNEATGATMVTSAPAKPALPEALARSTSRVAPLPPGLSALDTTQRMQELERQVQELTGEVQELRPPAYSDGEHVGTS